MAGSVSGTPGPINPNLLRGLEKTQQPKQTEKTAPKESAPTVSDNAQITGASEVADKPKSKMPTGIKNTGLKILGAAAAAVAAAATGHSPKEALETNILFQPKPAGEKAPDWVDPMTIKTEDGVNLQAWWTPGPADAPVVVHFHGSDRVMSDDIDRISGLRDKGFRVLTVDYRGYGDSEGVPTLDGLKKDAKAVMKKAKELEPRPENIMVSGQSAGAAVATEAAADEEKNGGKLGGLIVESGFPSLKAVATNVAGPMGGKLAGDRLPVADQLSKLNMPVMVAHGGNDGLTPMSMGHELRDAKPGSTFFEASDAGHLNVYQDKGFMDAVTGFAKEKCEMKPAGPYDAGEHRQRIQEEATGGFNLA